MLTEREVNKHKLGSTQKQVLIYIGRVEGPWKAKNRYDAAAAQTLVDRNYAREVKPGWFELTDIGSEIFVSIL